MDTIVQNILIAFVILSDLMAACLVSFENKKLQHYFTFAAICFINVVLFVLIGGAVL